MRIWAVGNIDLTQLMFVGERFDGNDCNGLQT